MDSSAAPTMLTPPVLPTGQEIYNAIMGGIEPELVAPTIDALETVYAAEAPEQKAARMERYQKAFEEYDKQYEAYIAKLTAEVRAYRHQSIKAAESNTREQEGQELAQLETTFSA